MNMMRTHRTRGSRKSIGVIPRAPTRARMSPEIAAALKSAWPSQAMRSTVEAVPTAGLPKKGIRAAMNAEKNMYAHRTRVRLNQFLKLQMLDCR